MEITLSFLRYGILIVIGMLFLMLFLANLSYFITGKILGSINDEFSSGSKLLGLVILVGIGFTVLGAFIPTYLHETGASVALAIIFILQLAVAVKLIDYVYDLGIGKSILFLVLSTVIYVVMSGLFFFVTTLLLPNGSEKDTGNVTSMEESISDNNLSTESSMANCFASSDCPDNEVCFFDQCRTKVDLENAFPTGDCTVFTCEGCASGNPVGTGITKPTVNVEFCSECSQRGSQCKEGYECQTGRCIEVSGGETDAEDAAVEETDSTSKLPRLPQTPAEDE